MIFSETILKGSYIIELEKNEDERGFFARMWDKKIFSDLGLETNIAQCSMSYNKKKGTLRGMHFQDKPFEEVKIVSCTKGAIFDVILDLRKESTSYKKWIGVKLSESNSKSLYIPAGLAHGFQTLEDNTVVFYQISNFYNPEYAHGIRWDDDQFKIKWPIKSPIVSSKDSSYEPFRYGV